MKQKITKNILRAYYVFQAHFNINLIANYSKNCAIYKQALNNRNY